MTITEFILARVAEREAGARAAYASPWRTGGNPGGHVWTGNDSGDPEEGPTVYVNGGIYANQRKTAEHIARVSDPERVLAECEAKRTILDEHAATTEHAWRIYVCETCLTDREGYSDDWGPDPYPCRTVRALAAIWADHPDYREEWR